MLTADEKIDQISDFDSHQDILDLSLWPMLYSSAQLTFVEGSDGVTIHFRGEELVIKSASGSGLTAADFGAGTITYLTRFDVHLQPQEISQPTATAPPLNQGVILAKPQADFLFPLTVQDIAEYPKLVSEPFQMQAGPYFMTAAFSNMGSILGAIAPSQTKSPIYKLPEIGRSDNEGMNGSAGSDYFMAMGGMMYFTDRRVMIPSAVVMVPIGSMAAMARMFSSGGADRIYSVVAAALIGLCFIPPSRARLT